MNRANLCKLSLGGDGVKERCITVRCNVDSCEYWDKGNLCGADGIEVDNTQAMANLDMEVGELGAGANEAARSEETCCRTYKPKAE
ncbi:MAG TPA: DUF1540 domain-containing protein [Firmicutes bacterium]|nr:DUF1540 domain-containing protein [Bacillota bacterium]